MKRKALPSDKVPDPFAQLGLDRQEVARLCKARKEQVAQAAAKWLVTRCVSFDARCAFVHKHRGEIKIPYKIVTTILPEIPPDLPPADKQEFVGATLDILDQIL
jgi:hypothetical protein